VTVIFLLSYVHYYESTAYIHLYAMSIKLFLNGADC